MLLRGGQDEENNGCDKTACCAVFCLATTAIGIATAITIGSHELFGLSWYLSAMIGVGVPLLDGIILGCICLPELYHCVYDCIAKCGDTEQSNLQGDGGDKCCSFFNCKKESEYRTLEEDTTSCCCTC